MTLITLLATSGCSLLTPKTITVTEFIEKDIPVVQRPKPVNMSSVRFFVVTEKNINEFKEQFRSLNGDLVFVALSIKDYENLSLNISDVKRFIEQQKNIILYYEQSVTDINKIKN